MVAAISAPKFKLAFLGPRYWPVWLGVLFLYLVTLLPYALIRVFGAATGWLLSKFAKSRVRVAQKNIQLCYPDMPIQQQQDLLKQNLRCAGMAIYETAMGWWWPDWRVKRHIEIEGFNYVEDVIAANKGIFTLALHNMNLEFACRGLGLTHPSIGFYRKHNNPLMDYLQYSGRARSNKYMIHKRNARGLLNALNEGELCLYLPDQDYGRTQSIFVPFAGVKDAATTTATMMFIRRAHCEPILVTSHYTRTGYKIKFYPPLRPMHTMDDEEGLALLNRHIADSVSEQPESYLWMHKRFKTRPDPNAPSHYQK